MDLLFAKYAHWLRFAFLLSAIGGSGAALFFVWANWYGGQPDWWSITHDPMMTFSAITLGVAGLYSFRRFLDETLRAVLKKEHTPSLMSAVIFALAVPAAIVMIDQAKDWVIFGNLGRWIIPIVALIPSTVLFAFTAYADYLGFHRERLEHLRRTAIPTTAT